MRTTFIQTLIERARIDKTIFLVTPDMGFSVFEPFIKEFPDRFLNVGIAEQNAIGVAAGLALSGYNVYVYSIVPFVTMRCFEQVRVDVAYMNTNVKLVGVGGGLSYGPAGATHHAIEDIAIMRCLPNMTVCCPGDPIEAKNIFEASYNYKGPMYIRLGKNGEPIIQSCGNKIEIGKHNLIRKGSSFCLITTGNTLELGSKWIEEWIQEGYDPEHVSLHTIKPIDKIFIENLCKSNKLIVTLEEHNILGGLFSSVSEIVTQIGSCKIIPCAINDSYNHYVGSQAFIRDKIGLSRKPEIGPSLGKI